MADARDCGLRSGELRRLFALTIKRIRRHRHDTSGTHHDLCQVTISSCAPRPRDLFRQMTKAREAVMSAPGEKRGRGRPPKHGEAMTGADRQMLYAKARRRDMAEVA